MSEIAGASVIPFCQGLQATHLFPAHLPHWRFHFLAVAGVSIAISLGILFWWRYRQRLLKKGVLFAFFVVIFLFFLDFSFIIENRMTIKNKKNKKKK